MITIRKADQRGRANHGWLDSQHTFSFANYYDPSHMGFRDLRVINEDRVAPGAGFPTHPHRDMEIISYVIQGAIEHRDSLGNGSVIRPGDVQRMSAGTGVAHSEFNASQREPLHFLQIWIVPRERGIAPGYEQKAFSEDERTNTLRLVASPDGRDGSVTIHQDTLLFSSLIERGKVIEHRLDDDRHAWLQVVGGRLNANGVEVVTGDGLAVNDETALRIEAAEDSHILLFDLA